MSNKLKNKLEKEKEKETTGGFEDEEEEFNFSNENKQKTKINLNSELDLNTDKTLNSLVEIDSEENDNDNENWVYPEESEATDTIFYQAALDSQAQCAKYTGVRGFEASTGEWIKAKKTSCLIRYPLLGNEIDELQLGIAIAKSVWWLISPKGPMQLASQLRNLLFGFTFEGNSIDGATLARHAVNLSRISLGQDNDVANYIAKLDYRRAHRIGNSPLICWGVSRGAATTFNALALINKKNIQSKKNHKSIVTKTGLKLVVLESVFESIEGIFDIWGWGQTSKNLGIYLLEHYTSWRKNGISPIKLVDFFPTNVPILFVSSQKDKMIPLASTKALAEAVVKRRILANSNSEIVAPIYFLQLKNSSHNNYTIDDNEDQLAYLETVHSLYKKYDLPYLPQYAIHNENELPMCEIIFSTSTSISSTTLNTKPTGLFNILKSKL
eukprot:TRINITY_DN2663_c1_g1_i1.p1 TRINITY_DN2663_c1_g1~~TRINITY_DN2663_c1_g1_i1.p1  ORF type:complete len:440 (-),score=200.43 TRINITY_DN2663_c1_g1_i1:23-1342(-)